MHGIKICRGAPTISHLLFVDDSFIFLLGTINEVNTIKEILSSYENVSRQSINYQKLEIYFSKNVQNTTQESLLDTLEVRESLGTGLYLGLPSLIGRNKKSTFNYIKDRIWQRIS